MYLITLKTKYNVIEWKVENLCTPEVKEVLEQPYIEEIKIEQIKEKEKVLENVRK